MKKPKHWINALNYHMYFKKVKDINNKVIARIRGPKILTANDDFIESVTNTDVIKKLTLKDFGKNHITHNIVDERTNMIVAQLDNKFNVFSLDGLYIGTLHNHLISVVVFYSILFITFLSLLISLLFLKQTVRLVVDSSIIINESDGQVVVENWNIFGKLESEKLLYPGKTDVYIFEITNQNDNDLHMVVDFRDINFEEIPMMFKLKHGSEYLFGSQTEWVEVETLLVEDFTLKANTTEQFVLEWAWLGNDDELDTFIGTTDDAIYTLEVKVVTTIIE